jgi:DNA repair protein RadA/Sms
VAFGEERLREALKVGFHRAVVPRANLPRQPLAGMEVTGVDSLRDVMRLLPALQAIVS